MVELMEEQDGSELRLSDQQADEVHRRLADPRDDNIPAEEVFARFRPPE